MTLFAHSSDWHLGASTNTIPNAIERQELAINEIYKRAQNKGCKIIIVAGDALHKFNPTREERDLLLRIILKRDDEGFVTVLMEGNHDREETLATNIHFLAILEKRGRFKNTYVIENFPKLIQVKSLNILAIPKGTRNPNEIIKECKEKDLIVVTHDVVRLGKFDSGHMTRSGLVFEDHKKVLYYAMGHLHTFQKLWDNAFYCGSPCQHNFGEHGKKGFLLVNTKDTKNPKFVRVKSPKRLVEVKEGDKIPKDAWVKLISNEPTLDLPDNVVDVSPYREEFRPLKLDLDDVTEGLPAFLAKEGLTKQEQKLGVKFVKKTIEKIGR